MVKTIETGRLYGVISPILEDGKFIKCEPVFIDNWLYKKPSTYYIELTQTFGIRAGVYRFEEVDIGEYGKPCFLPASRKKIGNGHSYFIPFQPTKNHTNPRCQNYYKFPTVNAVSVNSSYLRIVNVGILFPNKFVAIIADRNLAEEELLSAIDR